MIQCDCYAKDSRMVAECKEPKARRMEKAVLSLSRLVAGASSGYSRLRIAWLCANGC